MGKDRMTIDVLALAPRRGHVPLALSSQSCWTRDILGRVRVAIGAGQALGAGHRGTEYFVRHSL